MAREAFIYIYIYINSNKICKSVRLVIYTSDMYNDRIVKKENNN